MAKGADLYPREVVTPERRRGRAPDGGALAAGPRRRIASAMRQGRTPALARLAALALASVTAAASDADDARIHLAERRRGARGGGATRRPSAGIRGARGRPVRHETRRGVRGGEFPTTVPGGRARFLGGFEVTFASSASSDETPDSSSTRWATADGRRRRETRTAPWRGSSPTTTPGSCAWNCATSRDRPPRRRGEDRRRHRFRFRPRPAGSSVERTPGTRIDTESITQSPTRRPVVTHRAVTRRSS